jgi:hypothetical protein
MELTLELQQETQPDLESGIYEKVSKDDLRLPVKEWDDSVSILIGIWSKNGRYYLQYEDEPNTLYLVNRNSLDITACLLHNC